MPHKIKMYLLDISNSIDSIHEYLGEERNFNVYESNKQLRRAVERELEIIGEAINRIIKINPEIDIFQRKKNSELAKFFNSMLITMLTTLLFGE